MPSTRRLDCARGPWSIEERPGLSSGVRKDEMIFVGAQMALGENREVLYPHDVAAQTREAAERIRRILEELGADFDDVVKVEAYVCASAQLTLADFRVALRRIFVVEVPPVLVLAPVASLELEGAVVSIEATAMRYPGGMRIRKIASNPDGHCASEFSHGIRAGEMIFVGTQMPVDTEGHAIDANDPVAQAELTLELIGSVLEGFGANLEDVYNFNTRYVAGGTVEEWHRAAQIRANIWRTPGKTGTGIAAVDLLHPGVTIQQEVTAMLGLAGNPFERLPIFPRGSWHWPRPVRVQQAVRVGRMVFVGGQISADGFGRVIFPDDLAAQTATAMKYIRQCMIDAGGTLDDVVKLRSYYRVSPRHPVHTLTQCNAICAAFFDGAGPASTAIPVPYLGLEGASVEVEAIAILN